MKTIIKSTFFVLVIVMISSLLIACSSNNAKLSDYSIVYAELGAENALGAAERLKGKLGDMLGDVFGDIQSKDAASQKEILIGNTNRQLSKKYSANLFEKDYDIVFEEDKIVIVAGSADALLCAVDAFAAAVDENGKVQKIPSSYRAYYEVSEVSVAGTRYYYYNMLSAYTDDDYKALVSSFSDKFKSKTGMTPASSSDALNILIDIKADLLPNEYSIKITNNDITLSGANYYGAKYAADYFLSNVLIEKTSLENGFEYKSTLTQADRSYSDYMHSDTGLNNTYLKLVKDKKLNIVYFGGSITSGHGASDIEKTSLRALTTEWFKKNFPSAEINAYTAAVGASGSMLGAFRCKHDVIAHDPDLVFIDLAVGDGYCGTDEEDIKLYFESIIRQIRENDAATEIVVIYNTDKLSARSYTSGLYPQALAQNAITTSYGIPTLFTGGALCDSFDYTDDKEWSKYFADTYHPTDAGYKICAGVIREYLENELIYNGSDRSAELIGYEMPEEIYSSGFTPKMLFADELTILENKGWEYVDSSYWQTSNSYPGYYSTQIDGSTLKISFEAKNIALFTQYSAKNRIMYRFDNGAERVQNQHGNHPLLLSYNFDEEYDQTKIEPKARKKKSREVRPENYHELVITADINDDTSPYIISAVLLW